LTMGTVVFAGVDAPLVSSLRKKTALAERFEEVGNAELALARLGDVNTEVLAMVIGPGVAEAMALAQRAHARDRDVAVLLLADLGRAAEVAAALRYAPYLGPRVSWCERGPDEAVERALSAAVQRTRQRRGYREALIPWRRRLAPTPARPLRLEAVLERLFVQLPMGVLLLEPSGHVVSLNRRAAELLGRTERESTGARLLELVPARIAPAVDGLLAGAAAGQALPELTVELERGSGSLVLEFTAASVVSTASENAILLLIQDVTERARAAREREGLRAELESSQRMASLGMLAAGVGHEINNPLTYVMGNVELALERLLANGDDARSNELTELLEGVLEGANRIRSIVRELRAFSRLELRAEVAVDVADVIDSALSILSNELKHRASVVKEYEAVDPVRGDSARLGQVFLNLLTNAAQAIRDGQADTNTIRITIQPGPPGFLVVGIHDTGEGIPEQVIGRIFEPFFTTKPVGQGTGLGLAICRRIVSEHAGGISVESHSDVGTTFRVTLPTMPRDSAAATETDAATAGTPGVHANVLVIDDEPAVGRVAERILGGRHSVVVTTSGRIAVARIENGERFDLILCDVMMPAMSGTEVHERIVRLDPEQAERIVFMSGGVFSYETRSYLDRLPNRRLDKPFRAEQLTRLVELTAAVRVPGDAAKSRRKIPPA
jgi:PAS domain S-box-containing protein